MENRDVTLVPVFILEDGYQASTFLEAGLIVCPPLKIDLHRRPPLKETIFGGGCRKTTASVNPFTAMGISSSVN
jgi:hypothetical protein